jgi:hypothetical protein
MPTLFARRYMRKTEAIGPTEKVLGILILLLVAGIVGAFVFQAATDEEYLFNVDEKAYLPATPERSSPEAQAAPVAAPDAENPFPDPGLAGWSAPTRVGHFTPENLYIEIDGRDAVYLQHGVVGLTVGTYRHDSDIDRTIDVYWYDMGKPANALAMYRSEEPPEATPVSIGRMGYQVGGAVFFCQGSSYVQVIASGLDDADAQAALNIAERVAVRIGGSQ